MCFISIGYSQPFDRKLELIPITDGEGLIENTFSGGHNNLEHQFIDIDADLDLDIFYLDSDETFGWFKNNGNVSTSLYDFSLSKITGLNFSNWFYFVDIDADGDLDYFTGNNDLISFNRNTGTTISPSFTEVTDTVKDDIGQPIFSEFGSNPIFVDIDDDGDFDFITGNSVGTLTFYENIGTPQNYIFKFITNQWQDIIIIGGADDPMHGASSIDFIDIDSDNDLDLFWGDFFGKSIYVIENLGTASKPDMKRISDIYPVNADSVYTSGFNMPRFADTDGDNDYDLYVSVLYDPTVPQSLMYYENNGTPQSANHSFITEDFLKTLDVGNNSVPEFVDIDGDTDLDLFIGSLKNPTGSIHFLENTGSISDPEYSYFDSLFFNIEIDLSVSSSFGDLDNDGDYDLIIGKFDGKLEIFFNTGTVQSPSFLSGNPLLNNLGVEIDIGSSAFPFLIDADGDLDLDLIIGAFNGRFNFYENTGNSSSFQFTLNSNYFAGLDVGDNSTPFFFDYSEDGIYDLFSGNRDGNFFYFRNDGSVSAPIWNEITNEFVSENFGGNTSACFVDIDNDTDYDLFLGNVKGGLYFYINSEISNIVEWEIGLIDNYLLEAFPNPFNPGTIIRIQTKEGKDTEINIFNSLGEKVQTLFDNYLPSGTKDFYWQGEDNSGNILPSGIYFIIASSAQNQKVIKVSFLK
ncbi:MAG: FlgD immunoglobulin-like domain containing protein [Ignavibacteriales bacterium]